MCMCLEGSPRHAKKMDPKNRKYLHCMCHHRDPLPSESAATSSRKSKHALNKNRLCFLRLAPLQSMFAHSFVTVMKKKYAFTSCTVPMYCPDWQN